MADVILRARAAERGIDVDIDSAGISNEEQGNPIDHRAASVLREAGYDVPQRQARQVRPGELADYTLVLAMTEQHARALRRRAELDGHETDTIHLWREYDPESQVGGNLDVPDPWYGDRSDFLDTLAVIERSVDAVLDAAH